MKPQPESSTQEVLAGLVERVTYHNAENGFCVLRAKARGQRDLSNPTRLRSLHCSTITCCRSVAFSASSRLAS